MQEFRSFADIHTYLGGLMSETRSRREGYTLHNMRALMDFLDNPQDSYKTVHVAGTSGKSSTCYFLSALIGAAGKKVGLSISPHIDEVNERVQINNLPLPEETFCREFSLFLEQIQPSGIHPTYFELLVAFAFWEFARQGVDYAIIEVGLGGLLDGTNVIGRSDKVCVITDIGYDHTSTLGHTLTAIASQKAGIILPDSAVFCHRQGDDVMQVLRNVCTEKQADLHVISPGDTQADLPLFQQRNWQLAHGVYSYLTTRDHLPSLDESTFVDAAHIAIPGRMETLRIHDKTIILDGAHNPQKLTALIESIRHKYPGRPVACLTAFVRTAETKVHDNLAVLLPATTHLIVTGFRDTVNEHYSTDPSSVLQQCRTLGYQAELIADPKQAFDRLLQREEPILLVTGSFFLLQRIRPSIITYNDSIHRRS